MKDIKGYEGLYAVTEEGQVWSYRRNIFMKQGHDGCGYPNVTLRKDGKSRTHSVHRLVAETFIPNPQGLPQVDHIDEKKDNNHVSNLQWVTPGENSRRSNLGRTRTWSSKAKAIYCIELDRVFKSQSAACRELGLAHAPLCWALQGKRNTCGGYHWRFANEEEISQNN